VRGWLLLVGAAFVFVLVVGVADDLGIPAARALMGRPPGRAALGRSPGPRPTAATSQAARADIPAGFLRLYRQAAHRCPGLGWAVLAAVGKVESDHGRARLPGVRSGTNWAGAAGPMQFGVGGRAGNTWVGYRTDGNHDGRASVYDPRDAIPAAADYLCAHGTSRDLAGALYAYNHSPAYVAQVLRLAGRYQAASKGPRR
jgi:hypothetical protein